MLATALLCLVVGVADGDTLKVRCGEPGRYEQLSIRLSAIDAPEKAQPFGDRSKRALSDLCFEQRATIRPVTKDRYGRTVADVECRGRDAGTEQIRAGMAWVYVKYAAKYPQLYPIERTARKAAIGLWHDAQPVTPWEWRHLDRSAGVAPVADGVTCNVGPKGGKFRLMANGKKRYGCSVG